MTTFGFLFQYEFLETLFSATQENPGTAKDWAICAVVTAVLAAGLIFAVKGLRKYLADIAKRKIWTRRQTWLTIFMGLFPIFLFLFLIRWLYGDFWDYINVPDLFKGVFYAWVIYLVLMVVGHLVSPWRRELI